MCDGAHSEIPDYRGDLIDAFARRESPIRDGLRTMKARGQLRPEADPDALALPLLAAVQGGLILTQTRRDIAPFRAVLDTAIDQIRHLSTTDGPVSGT